MKILYNGETIHEFGCNTDMTVEKALYIAYGIDAKDEYDMLKALQNRLPFVYEDNGIHIDWDNLSLEA